MANAKSHHLSYYAIRIIAMATMFIDHIGAGLCPDVLVFRVIGRIAYPLYFFTIACSWMHTRNRTQYIKHLCIIALLAQPSLFILNFSHINVVAGFAAVTAWMLWTKPFINAIRKKQHTALDVLIACMSWIGFCAAALILNVDYAYETMIFVPMTYVLLLRLREHKRAPIWLPSVLYIAISSVTSNVAPPYTWPVVLVAPAIIALHKEEGGEVRTLPEPKWFHGLYFWFYPVHLALISLIYALSTIL